jgi:hypothetical protein
VKAVTPENQPHPLPELWVLRGGDRYRFLPSGRQVVMLLGDYLRQNIWMVDVETRQRRQLTNLKPGYSIGSFDVSLNGRQIQGETSQIQVDNTVHDPLFSFCYAFQCGGVTSQVNLRPNSHKRRGKSAHMSSFSVLSLRMAA